MSTDRTVSMRQRNKSFIMTLGSRTRSNMFNIGAQFLHRGAIFAWGGGGGGHSGIEWCGSRFMPQIQGGKKTQQRRSSSRNLKLRHSVQPCFCFRTKVYLRLGGGDKQYFWRGTGPEKHFSGTRPVHIFCLEDTSSN